VHNCKANQDKLLRLGGVEALVQLLTVPTQSDSPQQGDTPSRPSSSSSSSSAAAAAALTALTAAVRGHERACRRLLRVGLDALIDLAEAAGPAQQQQQVSLMYNVQCVIMIQVSCSTIAMRYGRLSA
jgi:hypothetical protein